MSEKKQSSTTISYRDAGVDIEAGNALVKQIGPMAKATARTGSMGGLGGFGGLFDLKACGYRDPLLVAATDGVGTKLKFAFSSGIHHTVGIDLVAMCVNDLLVQGAEPLFFLDYFATGRLEPGQAADVVRGIAEGCQQAGCQLLGGETAEMPGMYAAGEYDLAGFAVGAVERDGLLPRSPAMQAGDRVIGLASSGLHSNGLSLFRRVIEAEQIAYDAPLPGSERPLQAYIIEHPTIIYRSLLPFAQQEEVRALAHITGGGLPENIPRILPDSLACHLTLSAWPKPAIMHWIWQTGRITREEMLRTFNCGIGMVMVVAADRAESLLQELNQTELDAFMIGDLQPRTGASVIIDGDWR